VIAALCKDLSPQHGGVPVNVVYSPPVTVITHSLAKVVGL